MVRSSGQFDLSDTLCLIIKDKNNPLSDHKGQKILCLIIGDKKHEWGAGGAGGAGAAGGAGGDGGLVGLVGSLLLLPLPMLLLLLPLLLLRIPLRGTVQNDLCRIRRCRGRRRSVPGIGPGTSRTLSENPTLSQNAHGEISWTA